MRLVAGILLLGFVFQSQMRVDPSAWPPAGVYTRKDGVTDPELLRRVEPVYSREAERARIQGFVTVQFVVEADGTVGPVRMVKSLDPSLDAAAVDASGSGCSNRAEGLRSGASALQPGVDVQRQGTAAAIDAACRIRWPRRVQDSLGAGDRRNAGNEHQVRLPRRMAPAGVTERSHHGRRPGSLAAVGIYRPLPASQPDSISDGASTAGAVFGNDPAPADQGGRPAEISASVNPRSGAPTGCGSSGRGRPQIFR